MKKSDAQSIGHEKISNTFRNLKKNCTAVNSDAYINKEQGTCHSNVYGFSAPAKDSLLPFSKPPTTQDVTQ